MIRCMWSPDRILKTGALLLATLLVPVVATSGGNLLHDVPDFTQTDVRGAASGNGQQYCAPVAVANSFMWLGEDTQDQLLLIEKLASRDYMNTSLKNGTGTTGVLRGADKLAIEMFGGYAQLEYQGWRKHPSQYSRSQKVPQLNWIIDGIGDKSAVWVNVGWYRHDSTKNEYKRIGGHWVTLVGADSSRFIFHDPTPRAGQDFANEYVGISKIGSGTLTGNKSGLPTSAKGYMRLGKGMHIKSSADTAIVDGVVKLIL
jgi:hypothetical protein